MTPFQNCEPFGNRVLTLQIGRFRESQLRQFAVIRLADEIDVRPVDIRMGKLGFERGGGGGGVVRGEEVLRVRHRFLHENRPLDRIVSWLRGESESSE